MSPGLEDHEALIVARDDTRQSLDWNLDRYHKGEWAALGKAHGESARQIERCARPTEGDYWPRSGGRGRRGTGSAAGA